MKKRQQQPDEYDLLRNARDVGSWGGGASEVLLRAGAFGDATPLLTQYFRRHSDGMVVDLRVPRERSAREEALLAAARGRAFMCQTQSTPMTITREARVCRNESMAKMRAMYAAFPFDRNLIEAMRISARAIIAGRRPLLVLCAYGKDRTGCVVALLLAAANCDRDFIEADYLRSNLEPALDSVLEKMRVNASAFHGYEVAADALEPYVRVDVSYLRAALGAIESAREGLNGYLEATIGLDARDRDGLREALRPR